MDTRTCGILPSDATRTFLNVSVLFIFCRSPASWPLFHQVVVQSAPVALPVLSNKEADKHYEVFVKDTSCHHKRKSEKLDCLRYARTHYMCAETHARPRPRPRPRCFSIHVNTFPFLSFCFVLFLACILADVRTTIAIPSGWAGSAHVMLLYILFLQVH